MELLLICSECSQKHIIKFIEKDIPKFYVKDVFYEGKIILKRKIDISNVFSNDNYIQCYNCKSFEFNIKAIYN